MLLRQFFLSPFIHLVFSLYSLFLFWSINLYKEVYVLSFMYGNLVKHVFCKDPSMQHEIYYSIVNLSTYEFSEKQWKQLIPKTGLTTTMTTTTKTKFEMRQFFRKFNFQPCIEFKLILVANPNTAFHHRIIVGKNAVT